MNQQSALNTGTRRVRRSRRSGGCIGNLVERWPIVLPLPALNTGVTIIVIVRVHESTSVAVRPGSVAEAGSEEKSGQGQ